MRFSIITPSFRSSKWLRLCVASVADQGVELEHIVQDSCSDDGTQEWLPGDKRVKAFIEKDSGMYDAVNRGLRRASGDILAYLNCDEQYLPGALRAISEYFDQHPNVDVVFSDALVLDKAGNFLFYRKSIVPNRCHVMVAHLPTLTCATFFRRKVIDQGFYFDPKWLSHGDADWVCRLLQAKVQMGILRSFTSAFTCLGSNLSQGPVAERERNVMRGLAPFWARKCALFLVCHHRLRRLLTGTYSQGKIDYAVYTLKSDTCRSSRHVANPSGVWKA